MIKIILGIIIVIGIVGLTLVVACAIASINHVRCPHCGEDMRFVGNVGDSGLIDGSINKHPAYTHLYKCPHCGTTKLI